MELGWQRNSSYAVRKILYLVVDRRSVYRIHWSISSHGRWSCRILSSPFCQCDRVWWRHVWFVPLVKTSLSPWCCFGCTSQVKLKYFLRYMEHQQDDSPLYIFDSHFDEYDVSKPLLEDFSVPDYFPDDLFSLVGERRRPPYR